MKEVTLQFPTIIQLIDFESRIPRDLKVQISRSQLTIIGSFPDAFMQMARTDYEAVILDNTAPKNQLVNLKNNKGGSI